MNDDGWLVGGGNQGTSYFTAPDSAHITLLELGTLSTSLGGIDLETLQNRMSNFQFQPFSLRPTEIRWNPEHTGADKIHITMELFYSP